MSSLEQPFVGREATGDPWSSGSVPAGVGVFAGFVPPDPPPLCDLTDQELIRRAAFADPEQLTKLAFEMRRRIEGCTGVTAAWCPVHGDCTCADRLVAMDDDGCPLHDKASLHAATEEATDG